jgi:hypothetical protein
LGGDEDQTSGRTKARGGQLATTKNEATRIACARRERKRVEREKEEVARPFQLAPVAAAGLALLVDTHREVAGLPVTPQ